MFSLIITIISIALVAALALATIYYGGSAFAQGKAKAEAAQFINEGQQLYGAAQAYQAVSGNVATTTTELVAANYLSSVPNPDWVVIEGAVIRQMKDEASCLAANKTLGIAGAPICGDPAYAGKEYCCTQP